MLTQFEYKPFRQPPHLSFVSIRNISIYVADTKEMNASIEKCMSQYDASLASVQRRKTSLCVHEKNMITFRFPPLFIYSLKTTMTFSSQHNKFHPNRYRLHQTEIFAQQFDYDYK